MTATTHLLRLSDRLTREQIRQILTVIHFDGCEYEMAENDRILRAEGLALLRDLRALIDSIAYARAEDPEKRSCLLLHSSEEDASTNVDPSVVDKPGNGKASPCPYTAIASLWNTHIGRPKVMAPDRWNETRKRKVRALWDGGRLGPDLEEWEACFKHVANSDFLTGKNPRSWVADFDWIINDANLLKVEEGKYHR